MKRRSNLINTNRYAYLRLLRFARNDLFGTFYETINIRFEKTGDKEKIRNVHLNALETDTEANLVDSLRILVLN